MCVVHSYTTTGHDNHELILTLSTIINMQPNNNSNDTANHNDNNKPPPYIISSNNIDTMIISSYNILMI